MKKSLQDYIQKIDKVIEDKKRIELSEIMQEHLTKISFYQHERLIHLLVTILFAILSLITFIYSLNNFSIGIFVLLILLMLLLIPYTFHYYFLENNVQKMYEQYDKINQLINSSKK